MSEQKFTEDQQMIITLLSKIDGGIGLDLYDVEELEIYALRDQGIVSISAESSHRLQINKGEKFPDG